MKKVNIALWVLFFATTAYGQSITVALDTTQALQNSDAGVVAAADIDLDGDQDLVITGSPGVTTFYENDGSGNFTPLSQPAIVNVYAGAAEFADVDGDGDMDLLMTGNTSSPAATANLYLNDGTGSFSVSATASLEASFGGDADFGDVDGDNDVDLIMTGKDASGVIFTHLYLNNGSGAFSPVGGTTFVPVWSSTTEFIDVDNDTDLDLLIGGVDTSGLATTNLYENDGAGNFTVVTGLPFDGIDFGDIAYGDTDQDGDQDILLVGLDINGQSLTKLYINNGGTSFSLLPNTPFPPASLHSAAFADFNNDGNMDLLQLGNTSSGLIGHIYENQGANTFVLSDSSLSGSYNGTNITVDLNGDNKLDIVTTGTSFTLPIRAPKIYFNQTLVVSTNDSQLGDPLYTLFPNPTQGSFSVDVPQGSQVEVEVFDLTGRLLLRDSFYEAPPVIDLQETPGIYVVRLTVDGNTHSQKLLVR